MNVEQIVLIKQGYKIRGVCSPEYIDYFFKLYEPFSFKGILWSKLAKIFNQVGLNILFFKIEDPSYFKYNNLNYIELIDHFKRIFGNIDFKLILLLPYDQERGRVTGLLILKSENMLFFKFSFLVSDKNALNQEIAALRFLNDNNINCFLFPQLKNVFNINENMQLNIYKPLPQNIRRIKPLWYPVLQNTWKKFSTKTLHHVSIDDIYSEIIIDEIEFKFHKKFKFCSIHGDFAPWNIKLDSKNQIWIYDWEDFERSAPYLTDPIYFIIQSEYLIKKSSIKKISKKILKNIVLIDNEAKLEDIYLALLYLFNKRNQKLFYKIYEYIKNIVV